MTCTYPDTMPSYCDYFSEDATFSRHSERHAHSPGYASQLRSPFPAKFHACRCRHRLCHLLPCQFGVSIVAPRQSSTHIAHIVHSYDRYWQGRTAWSDIARNARTFSRLAWIHIPLKLDNSQTSSNAEGEEVNGAVARRVMAEKGVALDFIKA